MRSDELLGVQHNRIFCAAHAVYSGSGQLGEQVMSSNRWYAISMRRVSKCSRCSLQSYCGGNHLGPRSASAGSTIPRTTGLQPDNPRFYLDFTGTGNTFNVLHSRALQRMNHDRVFRCCLATEQAARLLWKSFIRTQSFRQVKLLRSPWDVAEGAIVGNFPCALGGMERQNIANAIAAFLDRRRRASIGEVAYGSLGSPIFISTWAASLREPSILSQPRWIRR